MNSSSVGPYGDLFAIYRIRSVKKEVLKLPWHTQSLSLSHLIFYGISHYGSGSSAVFKAMINPYFDPIEMWSSQRFGLAFFLEMQDFACQPQILGVTGKALSTAAQRLELDKKQCQISCKHNQTKFYFVYTFKVVEFTFVF